MSSRRPAGFFRGSELSGLISMVTLLVFGLALVIAMREMNRVPEPRRAAPASDLPPLPPPDPSPEFQGIQDRTPINARDTAAYRLLAQRVRETPPDELRRQARRELLYGQFFDNPGRYRGLPIHLEGVVRRVLAQEVDDRLVFPSGKYYEGFVFTHESMNNPYYIIFEEAPPSLPIGDDLNGRVTFDGYFFKLVAYLAGDGKYRAAPLIIGRISSSTGPSASGGAPAGQPAPGRGPVFYLILALGVLLLVRIAAFFFRASAASRPSPRVASPVNDQIDPEALSAWIEREHRRESEGDDDEDNDNDNGDDDSDS